MAKAKKKAGRRKKAVVSAPKLARQKDLPGMEDREIKPLQDAAYNYAVIRDQRVTLSAQEVELKTQLMDLMHGHKKKHYQYGNVLIELVPESEKLRVKIKKASDPNPDEDMEPVTVVVSPEDIDQAEEVLEEEPEFEEEEEVEEEEGVEATSHGT